MRLLALAGGLATAAAAMAATDTPFGFSQVQAQARELAAQPFVAPPANQVPEWLRKLDYDRHRIIEFVAARSLWRRERLPFQVQFFHPGYMFDQPVQIAEVAGGRVEPIAFNRDFFDYHTLAAGELPPQMGFAGFRLIYPLNRPDDELGAFLGASYFRFLCARAFYGLSARGLAIDTAEPGGEEFPRFTRFWLERPARNARSMTVLALLDGPSVAGAYRFAISPGSDTVMHVQATLHFRRNPKVAGLAPLTSMFWRGENARTRTDFRPEVHDSDGLLVNTSAGEWLWRPLTNPAGVAVAAFADENPRGFGLLQRDRNFENYQDLEAHYHLRPSAWVEPVGRWGAGAVRLVELPTPTEFNDNIVAFWSPATLPAPGEPVTFEYRLHWFIDGIGPSLAQVSGTRYQPDYGHERFLVDFGGGEVAKLAESELEPLVTVGAGAELTHTSVQKNPYNGSCRLTFVVKPDGSHRPVELTAKLRDRRGVLTEMWSYLWRP
jgi:glucans biosynthesis protein